MGFSVGQKSSHGSVRSLAVGWCAMFAVLELDTPFDGLLRVSADSALRTFASRSLGSISVAVGQWAGKVRVESRRIASDHGAHSDSDTLIQSSACL